MKWAWSPPAGVSSPPVIAADGTIYLSSGDGNLNALNPDGTQKWALPLNAVGPATIGADGTVYVGSLDQQIHAVNPGNQQQKWSFPIQNSWPSLTITNGGMIIVSAGDGKVGTGKLFAITPAGAKEWTFFPGDIDSFSLPVIAADGTIYTGSGGGSDKIYAVAPDGKAKWSANIDSGKLSIGPDGTLYAGALELDAFRPDGVQKWTTSLGSVDSLAVGPDGTVYASYHHDPADTLCAIHPDGSVKWGAIELVNGSTPAIAGDGVIYAIFATGPYKFNRELRAVNPDGSMLWSLPLGTDATVKFGPNPIAIGAGGIVYVAADETLYAVGP